ncbi:Yip1 family protein [Thermoanaerobacter sp. A7A]|uniref:Yip1 family protein n=1 Tax=Thermoanaerobacter sp. A7A TaxID=1350366 RepID=UPI0004200FC1|nr:Yip1 family protein [Thermoanaerobacter sp. A7A]
MENLELNNEEQVKEMNFMQRVIGIIISPIETMKNLIEKPRILYPIFAMAFGMVLLYLIRFPVFSEYIKNNVQMALSQTNTPLTQEQINATVKMAPYMALISTPIANLFSWLIITVAIFGLIKLFKGQGNFKQYLSITGYAYTITLLYLFLSLIVSFFSGELTINSSLTLLAQSLKGSYIYGVMRGIDLFTIWYYVVIAIGVGLVSNISKTKAYAVVALVYIAQILIQANSLKLM